MKSKQDNTLTQSGSRAATCSVTKTVNLLRSLASTLRKLDGHNRKPLSGLYNTIVGEVSRLTGGWCVIVTFSLHRSIEIKILNVLCVVVVAEPSVQLQAQNKAPSKLKPPSNASPAKAPTTKPPWWARLCNVDLTGLPAFPVVPAYHQGDHRWISAFVDSQQL